MPFRASIYQQTVLLPQPHVSDLPKPHASLDSRENLASAFRIMTTPPPDASKNPSKFHRSAKAYPNKEQRRRDF
jgi:hypothetical protein